MKLTKEYRDRIERLAIADTFDKEREALRAREHALFDKVFNAVVPENVRELFDVMQDWVKTSPWHIVNAGGWQVNFVTEKHYPVSNANGYNSRLDLTDEALIEEVRAFSTERDAFDERRRAASHALETMLANAKTFNRLKESWPEGKDYWEPVWVEATTNQLPALDISTVNKALGLPKEAA